MALGTSGNVRGDPATETTAIALGSSDNVRALPASWLRTGGEHIKNPNIPRRTIFVKFTARTLRRSLRE
jgi:hypothetical protein